MVRFAEDVFTDDEHAFFEASFSLARDDEGRTVLRGLSHAETGLYLQHWRAELQGRETSVPRSVFLELHQRHLEAVLGGVPRVA
ncbi:MAG TPA: hypothetical protein VNS59_09930 [Lysobacter sp.]|nr:hypothetical protein [Lysobacter sp.]